MLPSLDPFPDRVPLNQSTNNTGPDNEDEDMVVSIEVTGPSESDQFREAEAGRRQRALEPTPSRPQRTHCLPWSDDFIQTDEFVHMVVDMVVWRPQTALSHTPSERTEHAHVTSQMSAREGLQYFGQQGAKAIMKELCQIVTMAVMKRVDGRSLMFLTERDVGKSRDKAVLTVVSSNYSKTKWDPIPDREHWGTITKLSQWCNGRSRHCDLWHTRFLHAGWHWRGSPYKIRGRTCWFAVEVDDSWQEFIVLKQGGKATYALLNKALYGMLQASLLFWEQLSTYLINKHGFIRNDYDWCVVNKEIDGSQCTIVWYVDTILHIWTLPSQPMDLAVTQGKIHDYLGIRMDFSEPKMLLCQCWTILMIFLWNVLRISWTGCQ